uniref:Uncharacterized protein n=1 Tax=Spironucleus salmonicida TaxID=348837 RepID=V6LWK2_9EUKA|eukprot:EST48091.1 Hypothetical protein SS50377_11789 [Spironucleus salmonicida]
MLQQSLSRFSNIFLFQSHEYNVYNEQKNGIEETNSHGYLISTCIPTIIANTIKFIQVSHQRTTHDKQIQRSSNWIIKYTKHTIIPKWDNGNEDN